MHTPHAQPHPRPPVMRGQGRFLMNAWTVGLALSVVVALMLGIPTMGSAEDDHDFPCKGLKGNCFGLCLAAEIVRCDEKPDTISCRLLQRQLKAHKCTEPPPLDPFCPCVREGDAGTEPFTLWDHTYQTARCFSLEVGTLELASNASGFGLGVEDPGEGRAKGCYVRLPNGLRAGISIGSDHYAACRASLISIAAADDVTCP